eukprot:Hpha_TRINITY_DN13845_c0_g4::TRINITY_DN13845_c0_g4_i1::g.69625::m.69625/K14863/YTM1, WDR12; ribosome biogenesis protein YTM1
MTLASSSATVPVRLFTTSFEREVPEQTLNVPYQVTTAGLSDLVNRLLGLEGDEEVPFDFLKAGEFITTSLDKFIKARGISREEVLELEYTPSLSLEEGQEIPHDDWISGVSCPFFGESDSVVTASYDRRVRVCQGAEVLAVGSAHRAAVKAVVAVPSPGADPRAGRKRARGVVPLRAVSGSKDGTVCVWEYSEALGLRCARTLSLHTASVDTVDVSQSGELACSGGWDKTVRLWRLTDCFAEEGEKELQSLQLQGHSRAVTRCRFGANRRALYSAGLDGQLKEWDVGEGRHVTSHVGEYPVYSLAVRGGPEGSGAEQVITGHSDNKARLWDLRAKKPCQSFAGHNGWIYDVCWVPKGAPGGDQQFASASEDGEIHLHDLRAARHLSAIHTHEDAVLALAFSTPQLLWSGSKDTTLRSTTLQCPA